MKRSRDLRMALKFHVPLQALPQGDGSVVLRPGRPQEWLTVGDFAKAVQLKRSSVYAHIGTDAIPDRFLRASGERRILISAAAVAHWFAHWSSTRGIGEDED